MPPCTHKGQKNEGKGKGKGKGKGAHGNKRVKLKVNEKLVDHNQSTLVFHQPIIKGSLTSKMVDKTSKPISKSAMDPMEYFSQLEGDISNKELPEFSPLNEEEINALVGSYKVKLYNTATCQLHTHEQGIYSNAEGTVRNNQLHTFEARGYMTPMPWSKGRMHVINMLSHISDSVFILFDQKKIPDLEHLDEVCSDPVNFVSLIEHLISSQTTIIVTCANMPWISPQLDYLYNYFSLYPDKITEVSKCDVPMTTPMTIANFLSHYQTENLSIQDHFIQCSDMPIFLEEMVPGSSVVIQAHSRLLTLWLFQPPTPELITTHLELLNTFRETEESQSTCMVIELLPVPHEIQVRSNLNHCEVANMLQAMMMQMAAALPHLKIHCLPIKMLVALARLILSPILYLPPKLEGQSRINPTAQHHFELHELQALGICHCIIESSNNTNIIVPTVLEVQGEIQINIEPDAQDYLFFQNTPDFPWSSLGKRVSIDTWNYFIFGKSKP
ncbi:hypothetical protein CPB84DRAFT_1753261 [Gymnopilus junonius]|uniref:Uncharacterized protein n=1 Tax=Gymnopilus junonius TaxID=109634 RepID=A0A9P5TG34_GYMJU|nr:hypothetical protein CPB84DRAFT_1753261 [Gymnopilus junonius]